MGVMIFFIVVSLSRPGDRPATLIVRDNAFIAPRRRITVIATSVQYGVISILMVSLTLQGSHLHDLNESAVGWVLDGIIPIVFIGLAIVRVAPLRRPALTITPAGVRLDH